MTDQDAAQGLQALLAHDPAYAMLYAQTLEFCESQLDEADAASYADSLRTSPTQIQSGASMVATLVRRGGLARTILVDGEPYAGTPEQLQADESLPEDSFIEFLVQTTPVGLEAAAAWRSAHGLDALLAEKPQFAEGFTQVLAACRGAGATTAELQQALERTGVLKPGAAGAQSLHASYFTAQLERIGALEWEDKRWHTTHLGMQAA